MLPKRWNASDHRLSILFLLYRRPLEIVVPLPIDLNLNRNPNLNPTSSARTIRTKPNTLHPIQLSTLSINIPPSRFALIRSISLAQTHLHPLTPICPLVLFNANARRERGKRIVMMKGEMGMSVLGLVYWRTLTLGRNESENESGDDINTDHNEGAPLGWDTTK
jgi:hypothetical protein